MEAIGKLVLEPSVNYESKWPQVSPTKSHYFVPLHALCVLGMHTDTLIHGSQFTMINGVNS